MNTIDDLHRFAQRLERAHDSRQRLETVLKEYPTLSVEPAHHHQHREWRINGRWVLTRRVYGRDFRTPFEWQELNRLGRVIDSGSFE